ncbi:hypothetical protein ACFFVB_04765 [Formosa undariae]|uniref:Uncharacterized protein n=1 Tax=Formosa undariae TaxID=1325436 RepID=A0ABV5EZ27_9FLAO
MSDCLSLYRDEEGRWKDRQTVLASFKVYLKAFPFMRLKMGVVHFFIYKGIKKTHQNSVLENFNVFLS